MRITNAMAERAAIIIAYDACVLLSNETPEEAWRSSWNESARAQFRRLARTALKAALSPPSKKKGEG